MDLFNARFIIEVEVDLGKLFQEGNFLISFISIGSTFALQIPRLL